LLSLYDSVYEKITGSKVIKQPIPATDFMKLQTEQHWKTSGKDTHSSVFLTTRVTEHINIVISWSDKQGT
jgi:hypothetical protein